MTNTKPTRTSLARDTLGSASVGAPWDALAPWWKKAFTDGADVEYEKQILPIIDEELKGAKRILDLGCGEGQVCRRAASYAGVESVVGVDPSAGQLANTDEQSLVAYVRGAG